MDRVHFCECWGRDGLQNHPKVIPTEQKLKLLNRAVHAGYSRIEATSFSNPKVLPQFYDSEEILQRIDRAPGVNLKVTCVNQKAVSRAIEAKKNGYGPDEVSFMISVSEAHDKFNTGMTHDVHWQQIETMFPQVLDNGMRAIATLGTVYGCPMTGDVPIAEVIEFVKRYIALGATWISLGDTTGAANPRQVKEVFGELMARFPGITWIAHFHDTRGCGVADCLAAYEAGVRHFDVSLGAIGGQPAGFEKYHLGFSGNTSSEDLGCMFDEMGIYTGIPQDEMISLGLLAEEIIGSPQKSNVIRCGRAIH